MPLKFEILGKSYNQSQARSFCQNILHQYQPGDEVVAEHFFFLKDAFEKHHYNAASKLPKPIIKIKVEHSDSGSNNQFWVFIEGNEEPIHIGFSKKCFVSESGRKRLIYRDNVIDAARHHIRSQQDNARNEYKLNTKLKCARCGQAIMPGDDIDADHGTPSFKEIFNEWLADKNIKVNEIKYQDVGSNEARVFKDGTLSENWEKYHSRRFQPQPTHSSCNRRDRG